MIGYLSASDHLADDVRAVDALSAKLDRTVIYKDSRADRNVLRQICKGYRTDSFIALDISCRERELISVLYNYASLPE